MSKPKILIQLDPDPQASTFDAVVAVDSGVDQLFRHGGVTVDQVKNLVYGAIFTRGMPDLKSTAVFVGGSNAQAGEALFDEVRKTFFGPMRVSVMLDSNGSNTTAAAAVLAAERVAPLAGKTALVLGGTGPVGQRAARLLARAGAKVRVGSRSESRARDVCERILAVVPGAELTPVAAEKADEVAAALAGCEALIAAGVAGVQLVSAAQRKAAEKLAAIVDLNAVPPLGVEGVGVMDKHVAIDGAVCYGALGVGGMKMKIHRAAVAKLFESNDAVLDAESIFEIGRAALGG